MSLDQRILGNGPQFVETSSGLTDIQSDIQPDVVALELPELQIPTFVAPPLYTSPYPSIYLSISLSIHLSIHSSIYLHTYIYTDVYMNAHGEALYLCCICT